MILDHTRAVRNSALWAAYGDALGFITELTDRDGVEWRSGVEWVEATRPWRRRIGGRFGSVVSFPAGSYSDDTQLRLAVGRSISSGGYFDAEAFAKIELTIWPAYALGAGRASKQAAQNLTRRDVNWFSNFYVSSSATYWDSGGNGAAMRIQPHVWSASNLQDHSDIAKSILRNAVCTHGHPRALAGAVLHGWWLAYTLATGNVSSPSDWLSDIERLPFLEEILAKDEMLAAFWLPAYEKKSGISFRNSMQKVRDELKRDIDILSSSHLFDADYASLLESAGGKIPSQVGSGTKTALFAALLAWRHKDSGPEAAIIEAANTLGSDTDTIATMVGAILGARSLDEPTGILQDRGYIASSAERLQRIAQGSNEPPFEYPDPGSWSPPRTLLDTIIEKNGALEVVGLGQATPIDASIPADAGSGNSRQWLRMYFDQTVFVKRRGFSAFNEEQNYKIDLKENPQKNLEFLVEDDAAVSQLEESDLDALTNEAIRSGFDEKIIGRHLLYFADQPGGIEKSIAYTAIVVKARLARRKKERN